MFPDRRTQGRGFTLIEMVAVIVILCILTVVSAPKFIELQSNAYRAAIQGTAGAFASAVRLANLICLARDGAGVDDFAGYGNGELDFNAACYPVDSIGNGNGNGNNGNGNGNGNGNNGNGNGNGNGNNSALTAQSCVNIWNQMLVNAPSVSSSGGADYRADASGGTCIYAMQGDKRRIGSFSYDPSSGTVTVTSNP